MSTINTDSSFEPVSDELLKKVLANHNNTFVRRTLYDFSSVEHSFNVKLVPKSPINNNSKSPDTRKSGNDSGFNSSPIVHSVVKIMLPDRAAQKSAVSRPVENSPRSDLRKQPSTPIELFKSSRYNQLKLNNLSTAKSQIRTSRFRCPVSPIVRINFSPAKNIPSTDHNSQKNINESNKTICHDENTYCCFHKQTDPASVKSTIIKTKYMSLESTISRKEKSRTSHQSNKNNGTSISISDIENLSFNDNMSDASSSSSDNSIEVPDINVETSFHLSKMLNKLSSVQRLNIEPSQSSNSSIAHSLEDSWMDSIINEPDGKQNDIRTDNGNDATLTDLPNDQNGGCIDNLENCAFNEKSEISTVSDAEINKSLSRSPEHAPTLMINCNSNSSESGSFNSCRRTTPSRVKSDSVEPSDQIPNKSCTISNSSSQLNKSVVATPCSKTQLIVTQVAQKIQVNCSAKSTKLRSTIDSNTGWRQSGRLRKKITTDQPKPFKVKSVAKINLKTSAATISNNQQSRLTEEKRSTMVDDAHSPILANRSNKCVVTFLSEAAQPSQPSSIIRCSTANRKLSQVPSTSTGSRQSSRLRNKNAYKKSNLVDNYTTDQRKSSEVKSFTEINLEPSDQMPSQTITTSNSSSATRQSAVAGTISIKPLSKLMKGTESSSINLDTPIMANASNLDATKVVRKTKSTRAKPSQPSSIEGCTTTSQEKLSTVQAISKNNLEACDQLGNKNYIRTKRKVLRKLKEPIPLVPMNNESKPSISCPTLGTRKSSRSPKPIHAYWLSGPRRIIPVIRDINQLAAHYDRSIPIVLLPPKKLSRKDMLKLLYQIGNRVISKPIRSKCMRD